MNESSKSKDQKNTILKDSKLNWITDGLQKELDSCSPKEADIDKTNNNMRNHERCMAMIKKLFPIGREFCNMKQLYQAVQYFGKLWAFTPTNQRHGIRCHFGKTISRRKLTNVTGRFLHAYL